MKRLTLFLGLSLLLNALLMGLVRSYSNTIDSERLAHNKSSPALLHSNRGSDARLTPPEANGTIKLWDAIDTQDLPEFVARLRAAGFPEQLILILTRRKLNARFEARLKELLPGHGDLPYWRADLYRDPNAKARYERQKIGREIEQALIDLLGNSVERAYVHIESWETDFLPPEKIKAIQKIRDHFEESSDELDHPRKPGEDPTKEELAKVKALEQQQLDDIAKLLTPAELAEYNLRNGPAAAILVENLRYFRPTEAEYRALYPVYESAFNQLKDPTAADGQGWTPDSAKALRSTKQAEIQAILGADRYADYLQAVEPNASKLNVLTERLGLPLSAAGEVNSVEKDITQRAQDIQKNTILTPDQKTQQMNALSTEAEVAITTVLGADGFGAYKQYSGAWLGKLQGESPARKP